MHECGRYHLKTDFKDFFLSAKEQNKREWKKERNLCRFLHFSNSLIQKKLSTFFKHSTFIFFKAYKLKIL